MIEKRLYLGNLPLDVRRKEIKKKFSGYGNVLDVEIIHRKDDEDNVISTFAFVNIKGDAADLNDCISEMSHQDWNGHMVKIQYAKENFLSRLEKERLENQYNAQPATLNNLKHKTGSHADSEPNPTKLLLLHNSVSASEKVEHINEHAKYNGKLKMFSGTGSFYSQTNVEKNKELKSSKHLNSDVIMKNFEAFSDVWKDSDEIQSNIVDIRNFHANNSMNGIYNEDDFHEKRSHPKNSNYRFQIVRNEIKCEGVVKQYISSDSDSEGCNSKEGNIKVLHKGAKKFKKDNVNDISHIRINRFTNESTPFRKENRKGERRDNNRRDHNNLDREDKKQYINGHIEDNAEVGRNLLGKTNHMNPISQVSEERRQKSVLEKIKAVDEQKKLIKNALRQVDSENRMNKKIVFDDDDGNDNEEPDKNKNFSRKKSTTNTHSKINEKQQNLFDDGSDSDVNEDMGRLKINKQFEGPKGEKLLELQSRYAHDDRFALDSRFYESDNEDSAQEDKNRSNFKSKKEEKDEITKQLEVLEDVLGYQITKKPESDKKKHQVKQDMSLLRFDPTKSEHSKYVITKPSVSDTTITTQPSIKKKKQEVVVEVPKNQTEVSKERFYKIDESLKNSLKHSSAKSSGFSVLELIGSKPDNKNDNDEDHYTTELKSMPFKPRHQPRNPFRYDSSDTEEEEEQPVHDNKQSAEEDNAPFFGLWTDTFFLKDKDSRFKEADDFFTKYNSDDEKNEIDFTKRRKFLKSIVKWKNKNNLKNQAKQQFQTKLGGNSKKVRRKNRNIPWKVKKFQKRR